LVAPLVIEDKVIGIFLVQSINLTPEDTPAVTAFANQLAAAWNKAKLTTKLQNTISGIIQTIALIVETRDPYTAGHQKRVSALAAAIGEEMDLPSEKIEAVRIASLIHDLGKIHIPAEILSKPGKLTPLEYDLVKIHPQVGFDLLKNIDFPWPIAQIILQHHEKMNGSGYPQGLSRDEILIESRILAVADVIEAMSSHRPYRPALGFEAAKEEVVSKKNQLYDSIVVDACIKVFEKGFNFPAD
jgi:putative nucleotidyltransferase with HDIG domain